MKALVTGANGIVGRSVASLLSEAGWRVVRAVSSQTKASGPDVFAIDLATQRLSAAISGVDVVVHLAAALPHDPRYRDDTISGDVTRAIDDNVLDYVSKTGAYIAYASTCSLYNKKDASWKSEASSATAHSSYQRAKIATERQILGSSAGCVFRLSGPYGPGLFGSTVLARFIELARRDETLQIWGTGSREQDFIHADDVARFVVLALKREVLGLYNVAFGEPTTMQKLGALVVETIGRGRTVCGVRSDPQDGEYARVDVAKAGIDLGWEATISLAEGLRRCKELAFRL